MKLIVEDQYHRMELERKELSPGEPELHAWLTLFRSALLGLEYHPDNVNDLLRDASEVLDLHEKENPPPQDA